LACLAGNRRADPVTAEPTPREVYEAHRRDYLSPCAVGEHQSGGRRHGEPPHPYRTCFQRDRDRIMHCSAFRRLDFKTQVFVPHECDHFRTRLTHTLEVAQIGRAIGRALRLNEDLIEAAALAHDLGHPPFGHCGEEVLDELMADEDGFEHNRQSLRVVDYLEHPYPAFRGLNLTAAVRECLAKHQTRYDTPACSDFDASLQAPLEGQVVDLADEIAYTAADLDDALAAEWITTDDLASLALWRRAWATAEADAPDARAIHKRIRACKAVLAAMVDDVVENTPERLAATGAANVDDVRSAEARLAAFSPEIAEEAAGLQEFLLARVYLHPRSGSRRNEARRIIAELFAHYLSIPSNLPERYQQRIDAEGARRVICDYIAGMTDRFAVDRHRDISA
jgi:dGTPase